MLGPFDPVSLTAGITANLATVILQYHGERLQGTAFGRALSKLGLIRQGFPERLHSVLTKAIDNYFAERPEHRLQGVVSFLTDPVTAKDIGDHILNGLPIDTELMVKRLGDCLDVPPNTPPEGWPHGFNPQHLLNDFVVQLDACLGRDADPGILWIGRQLAETRSSVDATRANLEELRKDVPALFDSAAVATQNREWVDFERRFLQHLKHRFGRLTTPGARELHGVNQSLSIAYISLNVKAKARAAPLRAEQFLMEHPLIVIRGAAGSGKTTLLNWITWCCAEHNGGLSPWRGGVPFFVPLRTVARTETGAPRAAHLAQYSVDAEIWSLSSPEGWIDNILRIQKRGIVMIDGVDELPPARRSGFWEWLARFVTDYPDNRVIVTSRTLPGSMTSEGSEKSDQWNPPAGFVEAHLEEMSNADIGRFIQHWHDAVDPNKLNEFEQNTLLRARDELPAKLEDPANRRIRELCSTPLLCAMVCVLHWREEGYLPRQRVDLYDRCCDMLIEARDLKRGVQPATGLLAYMTKNDKEMVLQRLAFDMMRNKPDNDEVQGSAYRIEISREKALSWISPRIASFQNSAARESAATEVLDHLIERTGLLREPAGGLVDFPHRTFQEYLAACAAGAEGQQDFLAKQANDDQWHETIMLAAGTTTGGVGFGRSLIEALIKRAERHKSSRSSSQRVRKTCFALALGCLENLRQLDPALRDGVLAHLGELVPPRNEADARILSVAGDAAVPYLHHSKWKDEATTTVAACAQALRLIGTTAASRALEDGYISDNREPVIAEVCRATSINYSRVPLVVEVTAKTNALPSFVQVRDVSLVIGLRGLKALTISAPSPRNLERIAELPELERISLDGVPLSEAAAAPWPQTVRCVEFLRCVGNQLDWLAGLRRLETLSLFGLDHVSDLAFTKSLDRLKSLQVAASPIADLSPLGHLRSLTNFGVAHCPQIADISTLAKLENLERLQIQRCEKLKKLGPIQLLSRLDDLHIDACHDDADLLPIGKLRRLKTLHLGSIHHARSLVSIGELSDLTRLTVVALQDLADISTLEGLTKLRCLMLGACPNIVTLPSLKRLSQLTQVTLGGLISVRSLDPVSTANELVELTIDDCSRVQDFTFLRSFRHLKKLRLRGLPRLANLSPLSELQSLTVLDLGYCGELKDIAPVAHLRNLERLRILNCEKVEDLSPLADLPKLADVSLIDCGAISDVSPLTKLPSLVRLAIGEMDLRRLQIPELLLPKVERGYYYLPHHRYRPRIGRYHLGYFDYFRSRPFVLLGEEGVSEIFEGDIVQLEL